MRPRSVRLHAAFQTRTGTTPSPIFTPSPGRIIPVMKRGLACQGRMVILITPQTQPLITVPTFRPLPRLVSISSFPLLILPGVVVPVVFTHSSASNLRNIYWSAAPRNRLAVKDKKQTSEFFLSSEVFLGRYKSINRRSRSNLWGVLRSRVERVPCWSCRHSPRG